MILLARSCVHILVCSQNIDYVLCECYKCGVGNLQKLIMESNSILLRNISKNVLIKQWVKKQRHRNDQMQTYLDWKHVNVSYIELVEMLCALKENMAKHEFFASWNFTQFINCKRNLQQKEVIFFMILHKIICVSIRMNHRPCIGNINR